MICPNPHCVGGHVFSDLIGWDTCPLCHGSGQIPDNSLAETPVSSGVEASTSLSGGSVANSVANEQAQRPEIKAQSSSEPSRNPKMALPASKQASPAHEPVSNESEQSMNEHIIVGPNNRCLCGMYEGESVGCREIIEAMDWIKTYSKSAKGITLVRVLSAYRQDVSNESEVMHNEKPNTTLPVPKPSRNQEGAGESGHVTPPASVQPTGGAGKTLDWRTIDGRWCHKKFDAVGIGFTYEVEEKSEISSRDMIGGVNYYFEATIRMEGSYTTFVQRSTDESNSKACCQCHHESVLVILAAHARANDEAKEKMADMVRKAAETFRRYGNIHAAKGSDEGNRKALENYALAKEYEAAVAAHARANDEVKMTVALKWARQEIINRSGGWEDNGDEEPYMLRHNCEFYSNPEKGECAFCNNWVELCQVLHDAEKKGKV